MNRLMWNIGRGIVWPVVFGLFRLRRRGPNRVPMSGSVLVVCNHLSNLDPPMVGATILPRPAYFMAKSELFKTRFTNWLFRGIGAFPVERGGADRDAIRMSREVLARGECLIMFPEGTRSLSGKIRPFFSGAGLLGLEPGVTVIPAAIWGSQRRLGPVAVTFGEPVDLSGIPEGPKSARVREATLRITRAVADLVPAAGGPPQTMPEGEPSLERF